MAANRKKSLRIVITLLLIGILSFIILYPKIRPALTKGGSAPAAGVAKGNPGPGAGRGQGAPGSAAGGGQGMRGPGQQAVFASGFVIVPTVMQDLIYSTGSLIPDEEVDLSFETSGKIVAISFSEGTRVKKGELLAKINDKPLQAQLLKLESQLKLTEEKEFRQRQLLDRDAISRESYDQVATELQSLQADSLLIQARIAETELRAPFDGIVGLRMVSEGAYATTQTKIVRLVKISPLKIEFSVPERYGSQVAPGFPITFTLEERDEIFHAKVYAIDPKVNMETRMFAVRALFPNSREELMPGRFVSVKAQLYQIENTIAIPTEAVIAEMDGDMVNVYRNGRAERVRITSGMRTESLLQIKEGLHFGDTLLTTATLQLRPNIPVKLDTLITNQPIPTPAP